MVWNHHVVSYRCLSKWYLRNYENVATGLYTTWLVNIGNARLWTCFLMLVLLFSVVMMGCLRDCSRFCCDNQIKISLWLRNTDIPLKLGRLVMVAVVVRLVLILLLKFGHVLKGWPARGDLICTDVIPQWLNWWRMHIQCMLSFISFIDYQMFFCKEVFILWLGLSQTWKDSWELKVIPVIGINDVIVSCSA